MIRFNSVILLFCSMCSQYFFAQKMVSNHLTLKSMLEKVAIHNRDLKIAEYELEDKYVQIDDSKFNLLPDLSIAASVDKASNFPIYDNGLFNKPSQHDVIHTLYATNTNLYWTLYDGMKKLNTVRFNELASELEKEKFLEKTASVNLQAIFLFYDLYLQMELKNLMQEDIKEKEHQHKEIKDFYELGVVLHSDVLRAELELSKRKMTLIEIENQVTKINQQLNVMMGVKDDFIWNPIENISVLPNYENFNEALQIAVDNGYEEKMSSVHVKMVEKEYDIIKSKNSVEIGLTGSFQFSNPQIFLYPYNDSWYNLGLIGLKAQFSISELYKNKNKKVSAKISIEKAHEHHKKVNDNIRTRIYKDYLALDESVKYVNIYKLNVESSSENARILRDAYFNQTALITDLLDADVLVLKSKFEFKQSQINVFKNYYKLQYSKGTL